ncbi:sensor histidine kinase [Pedobacter gandavensis]|nr:HAMP domain-containing sensor histidine kinase [Pedobacter gandavensis]
MIALLLLQVYWIVRHYRNTASDFVKEVNLAFEDGIKKESSLRCDTIQKIIENKILDTNAFVISAKLDETKKKYVYTVSDKGKEKDRFSSSFSLAEYSKALPKDKADTSVRRHVAASLAELLREEDLENHVVYYRTQKLGAFMSEQAKRYQFDTVRLRSAFNIYLQQRNINSPYHFVVKKNDSTTNSKGIEKTSKDQSVYTKAFATYRYTDNQRFVRAVFESPFSYVLSRMWLMLLSSLSIMLIVSACMIFILKNLFKEKRLSAIKNDFISNITHEFKTPIATVAVAIEALTNPLIRSDDDKYKRYLLHAKTEIERLNVLVDKVLNISIYEDGKSSLLKEEIIFDEKITELISLHELSADKRVRIHYENNSSLKSIKVDKTQFQHALNNIIDNAVKYSLHEPLIRITSVEDRHFLAIKIEDNGIGIAEKDVEAVFEKFYRVSTGDSHPVKGYGLGLNYVKQIMNQHNGWCKIESKLTVGTTITLGWPV